MHEIMVFDGKIAKGSALVVKVPGQPGEHLAVVEDALFEVLLLQCTQPEGLVREDHLVKLHRNAHQSMKMCHNWTGHPRLQKGLYGTQEIPGLDCLS